MTHCARLGGAEQPVLVVVVSGVAWLVGAARAALDAGEAGVAAGRFGEALALWHGRALADVLTWATIWR